ncbi:lipopolysaccharide biosynthesis protein [Thermophilibacter mediterraneus]|uniref:lipopolysaccharide biosynthesis protein n=1 Tax=Thermophilibacter mediterraneus TaxID=1871031 RepID=UPI000931BBF1|nr:lipopolysaccharide biosynthesis protein [Thermophilibacter mediterraneus]
MRAGELKSVTIRSLFWKLFEQGGSSVVTLLVQVVMARLLAPSEFGVLAIMLVFVNVGNVIVQSGLNTAIIQAPDATEEDFSTVFWMSLALSVALYGALFLAAPAIAAFYAIPSAVAPLRVLLLVFVVNAYNAVQEAIVARELDFRKTFRATVSAVLVSGTVGIAVALAGGGLWALVAQQLAQQLCKCLVLALQVPWKPRAVFRPDRARHFFSFGWKLLASGMLEQAYQGLSDLLIGKVFTTSQLGFVSQGKRYPSALGTLLDGAIQPVMLSATSRVQDDRAMVKRLARRALKTGTFLVAPAMVLFAVVAEPLVTVLLGEAWVPCVPFLQMYCLVYALLPIQSTNLQVLNGMGRSDLFLRLELIKKALGVSVILFTTFVLRDLYAIVGGYIVVAVLSTFINASPNREVIGYRYSEQVRDICPAFLLAALAAAAAWGVSALGLGELPQIALQVVVMAVVYLGAARLLRVEEFEYLLSTARGVLGRGRR